MSRRWKRAYRRAREIAGQVNLRALALREMPKWRGELSRLGITWFANRWLRRWQKRAPERVRRAVKRYAHMRARYTMRPGAPAAPGART
jgi:hypothetical protein